MTILFPHNLLSNNVSIYQCSLSGSVGTQYNLSTLKTEALSVWIP